MRKKMCDWRILPKQMKERLGPFTRPMPRNAASPVRPLRRKGGTHHLGNRFNRRRGRRRTSETQAADFEGGKRRPRHQHQTGRGTRRKTSWPEPERRLAGNSRPSTGSWSSEKTTDSSWIPSHKSFRSMMFRKRLDGNTRTANGGKAVRVLRNGMLIRVTDWPGKMGYGEFNLVRHQ